MTTTWRIALTCTLVAGGIGASSVLTGCDNDVDTPPWLPNYTASGYGGKAGASGGGAGGGAKAGAAGEAGESSSGSSGEGGDGP